MTKQDLQKELKEKVKEGIKPSHLKKLKRSKSADDIPKAPPLSTSTPLSKSQSQSEIPLTQPNSAQQITQLKEQVKFHAETAANYLKSLQTSQAKVSELEEKLKNNPPTQLEELDNSLIARHQSLKDWFRQYQKTKKLDIELVENIDEASQELISQDEKISNLRKEINHLKLTNQSLQKDLDLAHRAVEWRKSPLPNADKNSLNPLLLTFLVIWFISLLNSSWKYHFKEK